MSEPRVVCASEDVGDDELIPVVVEGEYLVIARHGGVVHAFDEMCTHQQCSLATGFVVEGQVECPCHGAMFDLTTGNVTLPPAVHPLTMYEVDEVDGTVVMPVPFRTKGEATVPAPSERVMDQ